MNARPRCVRKAGPSGSVRANSRTEYGEPGVGRVSSYSPERHDQVAQTAHEVWLHHALYGHARRVSADGESPTNAQIARSRHVEEAVTRRPACTLVFLGLKESRRGLERRSRPEGRLHLVSDRSRWAARSGSGCRRGARSGSPHCSSAGPAAPSCAHDLALAPTSPGVYSPRPRCITSRRRRRSTRRQSGPPEQRSSGSSPGTPSSETSAR